MAASRPVGSVTKLSTLVLLNVIMIALIVSTVFLRTGETEYTYTETSGNHCLEACVTTHSKSKSRDFSEVSEYCDTLTFGSQCFITEGGNPKVLFALWRGTSWVGYTDRDFTLNKE